MKGVRRSLCLKWWGGCCCSLGIPPCKICTKQVLLESIGITPEVDVCSGEYGVVRENTTLIILNRQGLNGQDVSQGDELEIPFLEMSPDYFVCGETTKTTPQSWIILLFHPPIISLPLWDSSPPCAVVLPYCSLSECCSVADLSKYLW